MIFKGQHLANQTDENAVEKPKLTKEERKAKREAEKLRPKRKYVKKADRPKGIKISNEPVVLSFN